MTESEPAEPGPAAPGSSGAGSSVNGSPDPGSPARADHFAPGARVRTLAYDPVHHTRLPRYARGRCGTVVETEGRHPLPDERARGWAAPRVEQVYAVRFAARDLWGTGEHQVVLDLFESYLRPATEEEDAS